MNAQPTPWWNMPALGQATIRIAALLALAAPGVFGEYSNVTIFAGDFPSSAAERDGTFRYLSGGVAALQHRTVGTGSTLSPVVTNPTAAILAAQLQIDRMGRSHVVYSSTSGLFHRFSESGQWFGGPVAAWAPPAPPLFSMDLDRRDEESWPVVVFSPQTVEDQHLWWAERQDDAWVSRRVEPVFPGGVSLTWRPVWPHAHPAVAIDRAGDPHVAYFVANEEDLLQLRYARRRSGIWEEYLVWTQSGTALELDGQFLSQRFRLVALSLPDGFTPHILSFLPGSFTDGTLRGGVWIWQPQGEPSNPWGGVNLSGNLLPANEISMTTAADVEHPLVLSYSVWDPLLQQSSVALLSASTRPLAVHPVNAWIVPGPVRHLQALWAQGHPWVDVQFTNLITGGTPNRHLRRWQPGTFPTDGFLQSRSLTAALNASLQRPLHAVVTEEDLRSVTSLNLANSRVSDLGRLREALALQSVSAANARILDLDPLREAPSLSYVDVQANGLWIRAGSRHAAQVAALRSRGVFVADGAQWMPWRWIKDPLLEDVLRRQFFTSDASRWLPSANLSVVDPSSWQTLVANSAGLFSLDGLEVAENLQWVYLDNNHLTDLEALSGCAQLRIVSASNRGAIPAFGGNKIRNLEPLAHAAGLSELSLENNQITDLGPLLHSFAEGGWMNLRGNGLETEPGSRNAAQLAVFQERAFVNAQDQRSAWNWELERPLERILRQVLSLGPGQEFLPSHHGFVTVLEAREAGLRSLVGLGRARNLHRLDVSGNEIRDLEPLRGLPFLSELDVRNNRVHDLTPLLEWSLPDGVLYLAENGLDFSPGSSAAVITQQLEDRGVQVFRGEETQRNPWNWMLDAGLERALRQSLGLTALEELTWAHSLELAHLDAPAQGIRSLDGLELARNLQFLNLSHNRISDLRPLAGLRQLQSLLLGQSAHHGGFGLNQVSDLSPLAGWRNLQLLDLSGNQVTDLTSLLSSFRFGGVLLLEGNGLLPGMNDRVLQEQTRILHSQGVSVQLGWQRSPWNWSLDRILAARVAEAIGLAPGQPFSESSHQALQELDLSGMGKVNLAGLIHTPALSKLTLPEGFQGFVPRLAGRESGAVWQTASAREAEVQTATSGAQAAGFAAGRQAVLQNPNAEGLFRREQIYDARFRAKTMEVEDGRFRVRWSVEGSTDLQNWEEFEAFETEVVIPDKIFLRLAPQDSSASP